MLLCDTAVLLRTFSVLEVQLQHRKRRPPLWKLPLFICGFSIHRGSSGVFVSYTWQGIYVEICRPDSLF